MAGGTDKLAAGGAGQPNADGQARAAGPWAIWGSVGIVVAVALAAYLNSFRGQFIFDDHRSIVESPRIRRLGPPWKYFTVNRPVVELSLALNYRLGGLDVRGYHAVNLAVHLAAALALFGIVRRTLGSRRLGGRFAGAEPYLAGAAAAIWAVHPLNTQAVTYIVQRAESLAGMFYLLSLYCTIRGTEGGRSRRRWFAAAVAACALGMGTKEIVVTAPLAVLLYDATFLAGSLRRALRKRRGLYTALAATWLIIVYRLVVLPAPKGAGFGLKDLGPWRYALTQLGVITHYLRLSFWPEPLVFDYRWPVAGGFRDVLGGAAVVGTLLGLTAWALFRRRAWGFLGAWFFLVLAPSSSIMPIADVAFEHRMYLSLAAVVVAVVAGAYLLGRVVLRRVVATASVRRWLGVFAGGSAVLAVTTALGIATVRRNRDYRSEIAMWRDTAAKQPGNFRAQMNWGLALKRSGRIDEAIERYREALKIKPDYAQAHCNLGAALILNGELEAAVREFSLAVKCDPQLTDAHNNLGAVRAGQGRIDEAIEHYRRALRTNPSAIQARCNLGEALIRKGQYAQALEQFKVALRLRPDVPAVHCGLGSVLVHQGQWDAAARWFRRALRLNPRHAKAHAGLGTVALRTGNALQAREHFVRALRLDGSLPDAYYHLAVALGVRGQYRPAVKALRRALRLRPGDLHIRRALVWLLATCPLPTVRDGREAVRVAQRARLDELNKDAKLLDALAAGYAEQGRFDEAVRKAELAAAVAARRGRMALAREIRERAKRYRAGRPYRDFRPAPARIAYLLPELASPVASSRPASAEGARGPAR